jgi:hypothetical protein
MTKATRPTQRDLRRAFIHRLLRNSTLVAGSVLVALAIGTAGYHFLDNLSWLDSALNAAMILSGMGPVNVLSTDAAKIFATVYALFSGVFFLTMFALLVAPSLQHFLHRLHLDMQEEENSR